MDAALIPLITSASIACGFHAGDPIAMRQTVRLAKAHGVSIGAHPSYPDREHFGRREMTFTPDELEAILSYQIGGLAAIASAEGVTLRHVKPHGALYHLAARDPTVADAVARAVRRVDTRLVIFGLAGSELLAAGRRAGLRTASEVFADRVYRADGSLVPRAEPGAVIHNPAEAAAQAVALVTGGVVHADTICVHSDTPGAVDLAVQIRRALENAGLVIEAIV